MKKPLLMFLGALAFATPGCEEETSMPTQAPAPASPVRAKTVVAETATFALG